jgi:hypothetical protein
MEWEASISDIFPGGEQPRNDGFYPASPYINAAFAASSFFQHSRDYLKERFRYWNAFTIYAAFLDTIESATGRICLLTRTASPDVTQNGRDLMAHARRLVLANASNGVNGVMVSALTFVPQGPQGPLAETNSYFRTREFKTKFLSPFNGGKKLWDVGCESHRSRSQ